MATSALEIQLIETMAVSGAEPEAAPVSSSASTDGLPPASKVVPDTGKAGAVVPPLPGASSSLDDVVDALEKLADNIEKLVKQQDKKKDVVEINKPGEKGPADQINQYQGSFGNTYRQFPGESNDAFTKRQNTQSKIAIGGDMTRQAASLAMGPRRDPAVDIGAAGESAAKALSLMSPAAAIAGKALSELTSTVTQAMRSLDARTEQLKQYSPEIMVADAKRQVARMQSDMSIAQRMGTDLAKYTEASGRLEVAFSEFKANFDAMVAKILTPLLNGLSKLIEFFVKKDEPDVLLAKDEVDLAKLENLQKVARMAGLNFEVRQENQDDRDKGRAFQDQLGNLMNQANWLLNPKGEAPDMPRDWDAGKPGGFKLP